MSVNIFKHCTDISSLNSDFGSSDCAARHVIVIIAVFDTSDKFILSPHPVLFWKIFSDKNYKI
jgi:hypothetical protein